VTSRTTGLEQRARVFHHRSVDDATLLALYQRADALLLPLIGSTANNSLLEGAACGLPAITTDLPAVRAYLPGAQGLFSAPGDHAALADAVLLLQRDADLRAAQSRAARARAEQLAWPLVARHVQRVYDRVAATRPPHRGG
jgi:glycosyltransferase involved in cell wall biosynthesis